MAEKEIKHAGSDRVKKVLFLTSQDVRNTLYLYLICFLYTSSLSWRYTKKYGYNMELFAKLLTKRYRRGT